MDNNIPILDADDPEIKEKLQFEFWSIQSSSDYRNDRDRPYNGQSWTDEGERGKQEIHGITMRDLGDCFIKAVLLSCMDSEIHDKVKNNTWRYQDVYMAFEKDPDIDPIAIRQNLTCEVERMMGIFPNIPKICPTPEEIIDLDN